MGTVWADLIGLLVGILNYFYALVGDYGLAIILLTLLVRLAMLPLTIKQTKSMHDMQRIQPKLKALQKKYKNDKQKLQEEMMKVYEEHRVNPLGGCLPTLLQLPVMFALFQMLGKTSTFKLSAGAKPSLYFLLPDLTSSAAKGWSTSVLAALPYALLLVVVVLTTYLPQKMLSKDPQQNRMMIMMSGFMAFIGWSLPAGVMLYWVTTNVFTLVQQYVMLRGMPQEGGG